MVTHTALVGQEMLSGCGRDAGNGDSLDGSGTVSADHAEPFHEAAVPASGGTIVPIATQSFTAGQEMLWSSRAGKVAEAQVPAFQIAAEIPPVATHCLVDGHEMTFSPVPGAGLSCQERPFQASASDST